MSDLIERVEKATGGSRELDAEVFRALGSPLPSKFATLGVRLEWQPDGSATMPVGDMQVRFTPPAYTSSLDAVCALITEKRPGTIASTLRCAMTRFGKDDQPTIDQIARAALAVLLNSLEADALVREARTRALLTKEPSNG